MVVGQGAEMCSLKEGLRQPNKQGLVSAYKMGPDGFAVGAWNG